MTTAETLISAINSADLDAESYSGRGMYGARCVSVIVDRGADAYALMQIGAALQDAGADLYPFRRVASDSMGMGTVYYWPSIAWPVEASGDEADDGAAVTP